MPPPASGFKSGLPVPSRLGLLFESCDRAHDHGEPPAQRVLLKGGGCDKEGSQGCWGGSLERIASGGNMTFCRAAPFLPFERLIRVHSPRRSQTKAGLWFLQPQSRRRHQTQRRGQPLKSGALNAKNAPESTVCGALRQRLTTTGCMSRRVPISFPKSPPRRAGRTNLRSDALRWLAFSLQPSAFRITRPASPPLLARRQHPRTC